MKRLMPLLLSCFRSSLKGRGCLVGVGCYSSACTQRKQHCLGLASTTASTESQLMEDVLYRIREINFLPDDVKNSFLDFRVDGVQLGRVSPSNAKILLETLVDDKPVFITEGGSESSEPSFLTLSNDIDSSVQSKSDAVGKVMEQLRDAGTIRGWRDETYPVSQSFYEEPMLFMERSAVPMLGVLEHGVHINGIVTVNGETKMWIARRSKTKSKYPGMLDHIVAGGQPAGLSLMDNCVKECLEEAGIPEDLTRAGIQAAGAISYATYSKSSDTISRVVLFNYDLYLPPDFKPKPVDGEVEEFSLWSIDEIVKSIARDYPDPIKPNCYVVIIDFLLRHGHISPEIPGYLDALRQLRSGDCR